MANFKRLAVVGLVAAWVCASVLTGCNRSGNTEVSQGGSVDGGEETSSHDHDHEHDDKKPPVSSGDEEPDGGNAELDGMKDPTDPTKDPMDLPDPSPMENEQTDDPVGLNPPANNPKDPKDPAQPPATGVGAGGDSIPTENPIKEWPKPAVAFFISGRQHGYIEPCGCTGLENQKGGLARRYSALDQYKAAGWPILPIDLGNQVRRFGRQPEIKFQRTADALKEMEYAAVTLGHEDVRLSSGELLSVLADENNPFISANVAVIDRSLLPQYRVVEAGGKKVCITGVIGDTYLREVTSDEVVKQPAGEALKELWPTLEEQKCDVYILLSHATEAESVELAKSVPHFDYVITAGIGGEPTRTANVIDGIKTRLIQVGAKGMFVGVLALYDDETQPVRYERIALTDAFADAKPMMDLFASYQFQLKSDGWDGLGIRPIPHPSGHTFVGSEACADCHAGPYEVWKASGHAHATDSLVNPKQRSNIQRHFDPECVSCHATGWNPQKYFPYTSGYLSLEETPLMQQNGCENCHGPGSEHVAIESGDKSVSDEVTKEIRAQMRMRLSEAEHKCMECHDLDNSPDFHKPGAFKEYWEKIKH